MALSELQPVEIIRFLTFSIVLCLVTDLVTESVTDLVTESVTDLVTLSATLSTIPSLRLHMVFNSSLFSQGLTYVSPHFRGDIQRIHGLVYV